MKKIREIRKALGMTQKELGEHLGVSAIYIYMLETGRKKPSKLFLKALECIYQQKMKGGDKIE
ncbi:MAG: helix-turn-helix transcriptional regulator [Thermodesulfovibrio sp.]|nr:helix-turn-helix transcriptional regulator [Thermodesulfovibrio sp.]MDW7997902.1 helix-turn-helix transcriptional regulator [Thermodesulfovibrio sp.]